MSCNKSLIQHTWDFIGIPFRLLLFDQVWLPRFGWTTLEEERICAVIPHIRGRLLDIGAGPNTLVKRYGHSDSIGVDIYDWGGGALVVENSACLPFENASFDTITFVACFNHIPNRTEVIREARRLLRPDGRVIITMINPIFGGFGHRVWWYSEDKERGGMVEGEVGGMWTSEIIEICRDSGLYLVEHFRFVYRMNNLYIFEIE